MGITHSIGREPALQKRGDPETERVSDQVVTCVLGCISEICGTRMISVFVRLGCYNITSMVWVASTTFISHSFGGWKYQQILC